MALFNSKKSGGFQDVIRCDETSYLIWKWRPGTKALGESKRENSIRTNSILRVREGEVAVFVYKQKDGTMHDFIVGPYDKKIKTGNFPILSSLIGLLFEGDTPFQAEVYFINLAEIIQIKFGVPYFNVCDPRYPDFPVPVAVRGTITFKIADYNAFIKHQRLDNFELSTFQGQIRDVVNRYVKNIVANAPSDYNVNVIQLETKTAMINGAIESEIKERLERDFAVSVTAVDVGAIEIDKNSEEYIELKRVTKDITTKIVGVKTNADLENYVENLRIERQEKQYAMHKQTQTANLGAFQVEKQAEVGVAGAEALGQMGANGGLDVNLGGGTGLNPAAMAAAMTLGSAVGQNIASSMNNTMNSSQQVVAPPPSPKITYFVAVNGNSAGPYEVAVLTQMAMNGQINKDTYVWKQGMPAWAKAGEVSDLANVFVNAIPPIPGNNQ